MADFERVLLSGRTNAGLAAARRRGVGGRKPKLSPKQQGAVRVMYHGRDSTIEEIAEAFGVGRATFYRALDRVPGAKRRS